MMLVGWLAATALAAWLGVLLLPSRPWATRERIDPAGADLDEADLGCVAVLIPARNEAASIPATLTALSRQGSNLAVIVIDDQSDDATATTAKAANAALAEPLALEIVDGRPLPAGWGGKLWALEQGLERVGREYCLLLDAEIALEPGMILALLDRARSARRDLVSVMAKLRCATFWERLLVPPFIFFFKLIYPFANVNARQRRTAAAAGGCVLIRTAVLRDVGGFAAIRDALIDDCTLAARVKEAGHAIWLGLSEGVASTRAYPKLASFRRMVTRTAFTQLHYSGLLLICVCCLMLLVFLIPWIVLATGPGLSARLCGGGAIVVMTAVYWPTVRFYRLPIVWALTLPLAGLLFVAMTVESALNYWRGVRAEWKGRTYAARSQ
jgi:hopene-associated glycosyltransferase HpnB